MTTANFNAANFIPAVGTPLTEDERLHDIGFARQMNDLASHGIRSVFVAGSMGAMQLLGDDTYRQLIERSVELWKGRGELMAGAGDTSFRRTRDRIEFLNRFPLDGVVVLAPYFWKVSQDELIEYFTSLAGISRAPLYLYDLPQVVGTKIQLETALALSKVPNLKGIKCSDEPGYARQLIDRLGPSFRVIIAQPNLVDVFLRHGIREHLDGMYLIAPHWAMAIGEAAGREDWATAATYQQKLSRLLGMFHRFGTPAFSPLMNVRGIPGAFAPRPVRRLSEADREQLLAEPIVAELARTAQAK
jgi:dihydrodipicolinate synthase/N-acetylneuraminate lyase